MNYESSKDFDGWNLIKKDLEINHQGPFFNEREIWWCSLGINVGIEMNGKNILFERPVLILKKINFQSAWVLPLTSTYRDSVYFYKLNFVSSCVSVSQLRNISSKRLTRKFARISMQEFIHIIIRIKYILDIKNEILTQGEEISEPKGTIDTL